MKKQILCILAVIALLLTGWFSPIQAHQYYTTYTTDPAVICASCHTDGRKWTPPTSSTPSDPSSQPSSNTAPDISITTSGTGEDCSIAITISSTNLSALDWSYTLFTVEGQQMFDLNGLVDLYNKGSLTIQAPDANTLILQFGITLSNIQSTSYIMGFALAGGYAESIYYPSGSTTQTPPSSYTGIDVTLQTGEYYDYVQVMVNISGASFNSIDWTTAILSMNGNPWYNIYDMVDLYNLGFLTVSPSGTSSIELNFYIDESYMSPGYNEFEFSISGEPGKAIYTY